MLTDSRHYIVFREAVEAKIRQLTESAMNPKTPESDTLTLKIRVNELQGLLRFTRGDSSTL